MRNILHELRVGIAKLASTTPPFGLIFWIVEDFTYCLPPDRVVACSFLTPNAQAPPIQIQFIVIWIVPLNLDNGPTAAQSVDMFQIP